MDVMLLGLLNKTAKEVLKEAKEYTNEIATGGDIDISGELETAIQNFIEDVTPGGTLESFKELLAYIAAHQGDYENLLNEVENKTQVVMKVWESGD
jgi:hypothetical protein